MSSDQAELEAIISETFDEFDLDKSGYLTLDEIEKVVISLEENDKCKVENLHEKKQEFLEAFDVDGDKKVSKKEFVDVFLKMFLELLEE